MGAKEQLAVDVEVAASSGYEVRVSRAKVEDDDRTVLAVVGLGERWRRSSAG